MEIIIKALNYRDYENLLVLLPAGENAILIEGFGINIFRLLWSSRDNIIETDEIKAQISKEFGVMVCDIDEDFENFILQLLSLNIIEKS